MLVACGVAERDGKVLICKRPAGVPYAGCWEFPSEVLRDDEILENCLESTFFERLSVKLGALRPFMALDSVCAKSCRIFTYFAAFRERSLCLTGYDGAKWVKFNKLHRFRLFPDSVMIVKEIKKFF